MTLAHTLGQQAAARQLGLAKEAGLSDALRVAFTGRVPLRHGTSASRAKAILENGVQPGAAPGVSAAVDASLGAPKGPGGLEDIQEGLSFATRSRTTADNYARQQAALEGLPEFREGRGVFDSLASRLPKGLQQKVEPFLAKQRELLTQAPDLPAARAIAPAVRGEVLDMHIPRSVLKAQETHSPEAARMAKGITDLMPDMADADRAAAHTCRPALHARRSHQGRDTSAVHPWLSSLPRRGDARTQRTRSKCGKRPERILQGYWARLYWCVSSSRKNFGRSIMFCSKIAYVLRVVHAGRPRNNYHWAWTDRVLANLGG